MNEKDHKISQQMLDIRKEEILMVVKRKLLTSILSSLLFAFIFSMIGEFNANAFLNLFYVNIIFVTTYGVMTSIFSDWVSTKVAKGTYTREIISFLFHCLFGMILFLLSLGSAISFFMVDRLLKKVKIGWLSIIIGFSIVILVFFIMIYG